MGTFSRQDEQALMIGCGGLLLIGGSLIVCIGFAIYYTVQWVFA